MSEERLKNDIALMSGTDVRKCMRCGKCSGTCPSYDEMEYHPHQFVYMVENGEIEKLLRSESVYKCLTCFACVDRCPRDVQPAKIVEACRLIAEGDKGRSRITPNDLEKFIEEDKDIPQQALVTAMRKYNK